VSFPLALAAAIGLEAGETVHWELLDRGELHLVRPKVSPTHHETAGGETVAAAHYNDRFLPQTGIFDLFAARKNQNQFAGSRLS